jgi:hypothetical protein
MSSIVETAETATGRVAHPPSTRASMNMTSDNLLAALLAEVPSARALYARDPELWDDKPPNHYAVFGQLQRYMIEKLRSHGDETELRELFAFFEKLATGDSVYLLELLQVEIITPLSGDAQIGALASRHAGERTKQLMKLSGRFSFRLWLASKLMKFQRRWRKGRRR